MSAEQHRCKRTANIVEETGRTTSISPRRKPVRQPAAHKPSRSPIVRLRFCNSPDRRLAMLTALVVCPPNSAVFFSVDVCSFQSVFYSEADLDAMNPQSVLVTVTPNRLRGRMVIKIPLLVNSAQEQRQQQKQAKEQDHYPCNLHA
eukprot:SAG31_NODE_1179_length_9530_cov_8.153748_10_plen_146_part_00